ncbi:MAG: endonuclease I family protein, partial [Candidatus Izemoplasmataceae bacterium]
GPQILLGSADQYDVTDDNDDSGSTDPDEPGDGGDDPSLDGDLEELLDADLMNYYNDAEGLYGDNLESALRTILNNGTNNAGYGEARYILDEADQDPNNPNNLIQVYTGDSVPGEWSTSPLVWNREHVWPSSKGGVDQDIHHLKPADPDENSRRSNNPFGTGSGQYEPRDEVKGDIARILFYMDARYSNLTINGSTVGDLGMLLEWHEQDPVDAFEENRNDVIYSYQNNRNPFIDHPHLALLMYHDHPDVNLD